MSVSDNIAMTTLFIIFLVLFILMIFLEIGLTWNGGRASFYYDFRVKNVLIPKLKNLNKSNEICDLLIEENIESQKILVWRPALFASFIISIVATFFIKLFYREAKIKIFLLNFVIIFVMMIGFLMLINYHCYGEQFRFVNICLEKIRKSEPMTF